MFKHNIAHNLDSKPRTRDVLLSENENYDFTSMLLPPHILQGLNGAGFVRPSPIQLKAIPLARCGFDLIVQAKSGTGKTCVFSVPALENIASDLKRLQVIVLAPTREIAQQIQHVISAIGKYQKNITVQTFIGGVPLSQDKANLIDCQIAVGAPGRLKHLIEDKLLAVDAVRLVVLDEADKLLEESFQNDINYIFQSLPGSKQVIACSATYTDELLRFLGNYMQNATHVTPGQELSPMLIGLRHFVFTEAESYNNLTRLKRKEACLLKILSGVPFLQCLVFSNYHSRAESICNVLKNNGWKVSWIAGKQDQQTRTNIMLNVKRLKVRVLVTTDLTARGIDLHEVNLVVNMDIPSDHQTYLHRMGRAGRYGGHGMVITVITGDEMRKFRRLLGAIGGSYASAFVLADSDLSETLWSKDTSEHERVFGIPPDEDENIGLDENSKSSADEEIKPSVNEDSVKCKTEIEIEKDVDTINSDPNACAINELTYECESSSGCQDVKVESESVDPVRETFSVDGDEESVKSELTLSDFSGNEQISDSSNEDSSEQDKENGHGEEVEYSNAIGEFGMKLLNYSNGTKNMKSYRDLERSFNDRIEDDLIVKSDACKTLLEPEGTLGIEAVECFLKNINDRYNNLINSCHDWDISVISNILFNDTSEDCLSKILNSVNLDCKTENEDSKRVKDPELYSDSSSDDGDDDDNGNKKEISNYKSDSDDLHGCKNSFEGLTTSETAAPDVSPCDVTNRDRKPSIKSETLVNDSVEVVNFEGENNKKRKTNCAVLSSSSSSIDEKFNGSKGVKSKSVKNKCKKMKQSGNVFKTHEDVKGTVLFSVGVSGRDCAAKNRRGIGKVHYVPNNEESGGPPHLQPHPVNAEYENNTARLSRWPENSDESVPHGSTSVGANRNCPSTMSGPSEVQNWYNMWYRQEAHLKWYLSYSQYLSYMLSPKK